MNKEKGGRGKKKKRIVAYLIIIIAALTVTVSYYYYLSIYYVSTDDAFIGGQPVLIAPHVSGYVSKLYISDNEHVKKGQLLLEINPKSFQLKLNEAKVDLEVAKSKLKVAKSNYEIAIDAQNTTAIDMYRNQLLSTGSAISLEKFEHTIALYQAAKSAVKAQQALIQLSKSNVDKATANIAQSELTLSYTKIYAPASGYVTKKNFDVGSFVSTGNPVMAVVLDNKWVNANFKETQITNLRVGQPVDIEIDAYPSQTFKGTVQSIQSGTGAAFSLLPPENATGNFVKTVQRVPVKIVFKQIPDPNKYFLPLGLSVVPTVKIK
jgi:membrane fusion protein, multidrug efflux system